MPKLDMPRPRESYTWRGGERTVGGRKKAHKGGFCFPKWERFLTYLHTTRKRISVEEEEAKYTGKER